jgi:hypothetical protein
MLSGFLQQTVDLFRAGTCQVLLLPLHTLAEVFERMQLCTHAYLRFGVTVSCRE